MRAPVAAMTYVDRLNAAWDQHLAPRTVDAPTVISTFAGCGGSSLGYSMAGFRELLAVEWDDNAVATFQLNFPDVPVYHGDIAKLSVDECLRLVKIKPGELDVLDGSPPCQGFSTAGNRRLDDPRNDLFREFVRLLRGLRPHVFVMENVSGMVKGKMKLVFAECMRELKASGYFVSARLMNAMYFDVPQSRQRMIFIGVRDDLGITPSHPMAMCKPVSVSEALGWNGYGEFVTGFSAGEREPFSRSAPTVMKDGLGGSGHSQYTVIGIEGANGFNGHAMHGINRPMPAVQAGRPERVARAIHDTSGIHSQGDVTDGPAPAVLAHRAGTHWIELPPSRARAYDGIDAFNFTIVNPRNVSSSLETHSEDLGHPFERRKFSIDEVKRICSFPDPFEMTGSYNQQWSRLGNSVPPLFMRAIAEHICTAILDQTATRAPHALAAD